MDKWNIFPSKIEGEIKAPPSKSQAIRALVFAALAEGTSKIENLPSSPDIHAMLNALSLVGIEVEKTPSFLRVLGASGKIEGAQDIIDAGNSGLVYRLMAALGSLSSQPFVITGDASIRMRRPILPLLEGIVQLGGQAYSLRGDGFAPIFVQGKIRPGHAILSGSDSQPVTALLIAAAFAPGPTELFIIDPGETPWIDLTLSWLDRFQLRCRREDYRWYDVVGGGSIQGFHYKVPGDFSGAAHMIGIALATASQIEICNLDFEEQQADRRFLEIAASMGGRIELLPDKRAMKVTRAHPLQGMTLDVNECIDCLPILAVLGCFAEGRTVLKGAGIARRKESDRIAAMSLELKKMGGKVEENEDGLVIYPAALRGAELDAHHDHRIAMALTMAAMAARGKSTLCRAACVTKSYPSFFEELVRLGGDLRKC